jgi:hypothetical protein
MKLTIGHNQGCHLVYLHTKNANFCIFWKALGMKNIGIFNGLWVL